MNDEQRTRMADGVGFIAALDQSGGSTPKASAVRKTMFCGWPPRPSGTILPMKSMG